MPEDKDLPQRKTESDVNADADSKGKKAAKASSKKDAHRARVFQQRLGSGHFAPFVAVLLLTVAAWALFFSNPGDANIAEVKAIASGEVGSIEHVINNGLHLGALIALSVLTFWLLISPWWASQKAPASDSAEHSPSSDDCVPLFQRRSPDGLSRNWFLVLAILAVAIGGFLRAPLLDHSFCNDEEVASRKFFHGSHSIDDSGAAVWKPVPWHRTWFYNVTGNNHVLQSVGSRLTLEQFGNASANNGESLARTLPFAAGLLTIFALAILLWQAGAGIPAVLAASILALHPWHLRYSVEARGYSGMLMFGVLAMVFLLAALQRKSWPAWLGYGLCQLACLLCLPAAFYLICALNLGVLIHLVRRRDTASLKRWSTVSVVGAAIFFQIMTPSFLRMLGWIGTPYETPRPINATWFVDLWSHVAAGLPISDGHQAKAFQLDFEAWRRVGGVRYWLLIAVFPLLSLTGCIYAIVRHPLLRWPVMGVLSAFLFTLGHLLAKPMVFPTWYLLPMLLPFCIGLATLPSIAQKWGKIATCLCALAVLIAFGMVAAAPLTRLREYPRHPMRDAVETVRNEVPALSPQQQDTFTIAVGHGAKQFISYDPRVHAAKDESQFRQLLQEAHQSGQRLFVYCAGQRIVAEEFPAVFATLTNEDKFREIAYLHGVEAFWSITIYESTSNVGSASQ